MDEYYDRAYMQQIPTKAENHVNCNCQLCLVTSRYKTEGQAEPGIQLITDRDTRDRDFAFVIRRLQPPTGVRSLRFSIPDTCLNTTIGEVECVIGQSRGKYRVQKRLPMVRIRKIFQTNDVIDPYVQIMKQNTKVVVKKDSKATQQEQIELSGRDAAVVKYETSTQMLSELELMQLLQSPKRAPIWKQVLYIQNFIPSSNYHRIDYQICDSALFRRAETEIKILNKEIVKASQDYVSIEQESKYESSLNTKDLLLFNVYKIVHFVKTFHNKIITQGIFEWVINDECHFIGANKIQIQQQDDRITQNREQKQVPTVAFPSFEIKNDQIIQLYTDIMHNEYQKKKQELGLNENTFSIAKDKESEQIFNEIYQGKHNFHQTFKDMSSYLKSESSLLAFLRQKRPLARKLTPAIRMQTEVSQPKLRPRTQTQHRMRSLSRQSYQSQPPSQKINTLPFLLYN